MTAVVGIAIPEYPRFLMTSEKASPKLAHVVDGYLAAVHYGAPATTSGVANTCTNASDACASGCIFYTGRGEGDNTVAHTIHAARISRTRYLFRDPEAFMIRLSRELRNLVKRAHKHGKRAAARLNGMTDIPWDTLACPRDGVWYANVYHAFPDIMFYEYTKVFAFWERAQSIPNLHVTFSLSENNDAQAARVLAAGGNVAVVVRGGYAALESGTWSGYQACDGDAYDLRFLDPANHVVVLRVKGRANQRHDGGGFFRDPHATLDTARMPMVRKSIGFMGTHAVAATLRSVAERESLEHAAD
jgi:hypothetical protein